MMKTSTFKGFGSLKSPIDLLQKIRHDFERLRDAPEDVYAAFDFFVSAYHVLDWLHPNDEAGKKAEEVNYPLLQVCSHLANGAKHFEATAKQHTSVHDVVSEAGAYQRGAFQSSAFQVGGLFVRLDGQAASLFGAKIEAIAFAQKVLAHWEADPRLAERSEGNDS
ncbi:MAG: hypothetical protein L0Z68_06035 [Gammaproteobacteria bacterium]|nr:hypothetical protein [Gammaproteobacteria bacterium]